MKLNAKSVLLGFGLGIIFSSSLTLMMSSTKNNLSIPKQQLTDTQILKRAKQLGWVDSNEFVQVSNSQENQKLENEPRKNLEQEFEVIIIKKNESSHNVIKKLKDAGLIEDEKAFTEYIQDEGLQAKIRTGTFKIKKGVDYKTIMNILTKSKS